MLNDDIDWENFEKLHVVKRLRELVGKWWQVQINFTDSKGRLQGVSKGSFFKPLNTICKAIIQSKVGFKDRRNTAVNTTVAAMKSKKATLSSCTTGISTLAFPIKVNNKFFGCVYGDGFLAADTAVEQKVLMKSYLNRNFSAKPELAEQINYLPVLREKDLGYLSELIEMVVEEIIQSQASLKTQKAKVDDLSKQLTERFSFNQMIGKSAAMQSLYRIIEQIADTDSTVLVNGENGTGKELISKSLHFNSSRKDNKFLIINCGAFNENLLESELFGYVKGAFTGANQDKKGVFEEADGGTLFLDEIGETTLAMQVKMLRVLQEGTFIPVGSTVTKKSNVRIVAATNRNLKDMIKEGTFRQDLFYRLNVINILVPSLRDRKDDIPLLVDHFLKKKNKKMTKTLESETLNKLINHDWPGNVRELENEVERLSVLSGSNTEIPDNLLSENIQAGEKLTKSSSSYTEHALLKDAVEELERDMILEGLRRTDWNKSRLAKELGISRAGLIMKVDKYELDKRGI